MRTVQPRWPAGPPWADNALPGTVTTSLNKNLQLRVSGNSYPYGIRRFTLRASALFTSVNFFKRRIRFGPFVPNKCRLPECDRTIFPFFVILKRFAAPRCVFNFSFLATVSFSQLFFLRCRFYTTTCSAQNKFQIFYDVAGGPGAGVAPFFAASSAIKIFASIRGPSSTCAYSPTSFSRRSIFLRLTS
jgi:hypothetical protein